MCAHIQAKTFKCKKIKHIYVTAGQKAERLHSSQSLEMLWSSSKLQTYSALSFLFFINNPACGYLVQGGALCKWWFESCSEHSSSSLWFGIIAGGLWLSFMLFRGSLSSVIKGRLIADHVEHLHPFHCSPACTSPVYPPDPSPLNPCLILVVVHPLKESHSAERLAERTPLRQSNELV